MIPTKESTVLGTLTRQMTTGLNNECYSISAGCPHLARRLSGPAFACMRERADLMKTEQPRDLGYMQLAVIEVTNR
jgi:hypothetical protein